MGFRQDSKKTMLFTMDFTVVFKTLPTLIYRDENGQMTKRMKLFSLPPHSLKNLKICLPSACFYKSPPPILQIKRFIHPHKVKAAFSQNSHFYSPRLEVSKMKVRFVYTVSWKQQKFYFIITYEMKR